MRSDLVVYPLLGALSGALLAGSAVLIWAHHQYTVGMSNEAIAKVLAEGAVAGAALGLAAAFVRIRPG